MSKLELNVWIKNTDTEYLKRYTGVKTDKGISRFKAAFTSFLVNNAISDNANLKAVMQSFKASLAAK